MARNYTTYEVLTSNLDRLCENEVHLGLLFVSAVSGLTKWIASSMMCKGAVTYRNASSECVPDIELESCQVKDFIPIKKFSTDDLPNNYAEEKLTESIRTLAQLTVQVTWKFDGKCRFGSGKVYILENTSILDNTSKKCPCTKCNSSKSITPNDKWWLILVLTSSYIVKNKKEAMSVTCRLFYETEDSPVVTIDGRGLVLPPATSEMRKLVCVTCDQNIADSVNKSLEAFQYQYKNCYDIFYPIDRSEKLLVIVSHPHGGPQKVSIRSISKKTAECFGLCKILRNGSKTFSGSAGAYLYMV